MIGGIGWSEILVIILVVLVIFGAGRFPRIMEDFARGIKSFKKTMREEDKPKKAPAKRTPAKRRSKNK
jgi:sec-independent protein translocase protein TatA